MKNKLKLRDLEVQSFVTSLNSRDKKEIVGGNASVAACTGANCPISGIKPCFYTVPVIYC